MYLLLNWFLISISGKHLSELCKAEYPKLVKYCLWLLAELAVIAADIPEGFLLINYFSYQILICSLMQHKKKINKYLHSVCIYMINMFNGCFDGLIILMFVAVIGTAFGLNILLHIPVWVGVLLTGLSTLLLLGLQRYGV